MERGPGGEVKCRAILLLLILLILALPVHAQDENILSRVNDKPITLDEFQARVRFVRWQYLKELDKLYEGTGGNPALGEAYARSRIEALEDPVLLGSAVLDLMEEERLLWQTAAQLNLSPTADDAEEIGVDFFSAWTEIAPEELLQNENAQAFITAWYAEAVAVSGMSEKDIRGIFATEALRRVLYNYVGANVPTEELAIQSRHILCAFDESPEAYAAAETCIESAQLRLSAGETVSEIINSLSSDIPIMSGSDLGWVLVSYLPQPYVHAARDAELNTVIGPVETEYGLHLIEVLDRRTQTLSETELAASKQGYFQLWLDTLWAETAVERSPDWESAVPDEPGLDILRQEVRETLETLQEGSSAP